MNWVKMKEEGYCQQPAGRSGSLSPLLFLSLETPLIDGEVAFRQHSFGNTPSPPSLFPPSFSLFEPLRKEVVSQENPFDHNGQLILSKLDPSIPLSPFPIPLFLFLLNNLPRGKERDACDNSHTPSSPLLFFFFLGLSLFSQLMNGESAIKTIES